MDQIKTGRFLKELRKEKELTQEKLAEKLNVTSRSISRWENGNTMPDIGILAELADLYGVDIREIIDGERKCEENMMNKETMETLQLVSEYSNAKENKHVKKLRNIFLMIIAGLILTVLALAFSFYSKYFPVFKAAKKTLENGISGAMFEESLSKEKASFGGDYFFGQSMYGVCVHDESYTEPLLKNGKYYPDGDISAPYYLEITENKYLCYKPSSGDAGDIFEMIYEKWKISLENTPDFEKEYVYKQGLDIGGIAKILEPTEFRVITSHSLDMPSIYTKWEEYTPPYEGAYRGEKYVPVYDKGYVMFHLEYETSENGVIGADGTERYGSYPKLDENGNYMIHDLIGSGSLIWVCD